MENLRIAVSKNFESFLALSVAFWILTALLIHPVAALNTNTHYYAGWFAQNASFDFLGVYSGAAYQQAPNVNLASNAFIASWLTIAENAGIAWLQLGVSYSNQAESPSCPAGDQTYIYAEIVDLSVGQVSCYELTSTSNGSTHSYRIWLDHVTLGTYYWYFAYDGYTALSPGNSYISGAAHASLEYFTGQ